MKCIQADVFGILKAPCLFCSLYASGVPFQIFEYRCKAWYQQILKLTAIANSEIYLELLIDDLKLIKHCISAPLFNTNDRRNFSR